MRLIGVGLLIVAVILVVALVVFWIASALRGGAQAVLRQHRKLMVKAARASKRGDHGVANVYQESADDLMRQIERMK